MIESQVDYAMQHIERLVRDDLVWIDVRPAQMERFNDEVQKAISEIKVWQAGCNGYYRTPSGRVVTQWPYSMSDFRNRTTDPDDDAYEVARR